MTQMTQSSK